MILSLKDVQIRDRVRYRVRQKTPGSGWITYSRNGGWYSINTKNLRPDTQVVLICHPMMSQLPRLYRLLAIPAEDHENGVDCRYEWISPDGKNFEEMFGSGHETVPDSKCFYSFGKILIDPPVEKVRILGCQRISDFGATARAGRVTLQGEIENGVFQINDNDSGT